VKKKDRCGKCLDPGDPQFDKSCTDCAGVINGRKKIDKCGKCVDPYSVSSKHCSK
jgi:hypothetical protein